MKVTFPDPHTGEKRLSHNLRNVYFHRNLDCIRKINDNVEIQDIILHDEILADLKDEHKEVLRQFGLTIL